MTSRLAVLFVLAASPAFAQAPGATPSAPQAVACTELDGGRVCGARWVAVGDESGYQHRERRTNIATNPIGLMIGFYGISVSTAVSQNLALRLDANSWSFDDARLSGYELGASLPIYLQRVYQGLFVEPGIVVHASKPHSYATAAAGCVDCGGTSMPDRRTWVGPEVLFGVHKTFESGLNAAIALGFAKKIATSEPMDDHPELEGYFRVGYAF